MLLQPSGRKTTRQLVKSSISTRRQVLQTIIFFVFKTSPIKSACSPTAPYVNDGTGSSLEFGGQDEELDLIRRIHVQLKFARNFTNDFPHDEEKAIC